MTWQDICERKRVARNAQLPQKWLVKEIPDSRDGQSLLDIPNSCGILTPREIEITTNHDAVDLVQHLAQGFYTAAEVTVAFCKRATIAHSLVNCLTEVFFDEAIERARELDKVREENPGKSLQPLHGLPISIKDSFKVLGKDATIGMTCFVNKPAESNSAMVDYLLSLGAVLYCKTNVPQTMMTADSDNNVFGRTLNPSNTNLTAGGSTGGEGALIALRGSILGVGTDVAGSIRIPSLCNGIYGFKPSANITPYSGQQSPVAPGIPGITPSAGPMATSARACRFFMETLMKGSPQDFDVVSLNVRWGDLESEKTPLRIGVLADDGMYTPTPPMRRAFNESVKRLAASGMVCIPIQIPNIASIMANVWDLYSLDGARFTVDLIESSGEPLTPSVAVTGLVTTPPKSTNRIFELHAARAAAQKAVQKIWKEHNLDCILTLPAPHTATPLDKWIAITYTCIFNYLDYPACVIPVGRVEKTDVKDEHVGYGTKDDEVYGLYTGPEDYQNAPVAVQFVGFRQHDEELCNIVEQVDAILKAK